MAEKIIFAKEGMQYNRVLEALDQNKSQDEPLTLAELREAYLSISGGDNKLRVIIARLAASYAIEEIEEIWGAVRCQPRTWGRYPKVISYILYGSGRKAAIPPDRRILVDRHPVTNDRLTNSARASPSFPVVQAQPSQPVRASNMAPPVGETSSLDPAAIEAAMHAELDKPAQQQIGWTPWKAIFNLEVHPGLHSCWPYVADDNR